MVRYLKHMSGKYVINTINHLNPQKVLAIDDVKYNPCNVRLMAVALRHILLLDIDDESLTDMVSNIKFQINEDEFNYIYKEVRHIYAVELYHILAVFGIYEK